MPSLPAFFRIGGIVWTSVDGYANGCIYSDILSMPISFDFLTRKLNKHLAMLNSIEHMSTEFCYLMSAACFPRERNPHAKAQRRKGI